MTSSNPVRWDRTLYRGTDHEWTLRRVDSAGTPEIPTAAQAQIRPYFAGPVWIECAVDIDDVDGWVNITIPKAQTEDDDDWATRVSGVWDLEVDSAGRTSRWVQGTVAVSQDVTRELP